MMGAIGSVLSCPPHKKKIKSNKKNMQTKRKKTTELRTYFFCITFTLDIIFPIILLNYTVTQQGWAWPELLVHFGDKAWGIRVTDSPPALSDARFWPETWRHGIWNFKNKQKEKHQVKPRFIFLFFFFQMRSQSGFAQGLSRFRW